MGNLTIVECDQEVIQVVVTQLYYVVNKLKPKDNIIVVIQFLLS